MADRFLVPGGADNNWSTAGNWSFASGGPGGSSAPGAADSAYIDGNSGTSPIIVLDSAVTLRNFYVQSTAAVATLIDLAGFDLTSGVIELSAGTLSLNGGNVTTKNLTTSSTGAKITGNGGETIELTQKVAAAATTHYLADDGDDIGFGTQGNPWRTIGKAESVLATDVRCLFKRGDVFPVADGFTMDPDGGYFGAWSTGDLPIFELPAGAELILDTPATTWTWYESLIRFAEAVGGVKRPNDMAGGMDELTGGIHG